MTRRVSRLKAYVSISRLTLDGQIIFTAILRDITQKRQAEAELEHLALYDTLTDLPNRVLLYKILQRTIDSAGPKGSFALFFIGLDHFKVINETLGHPAGDRALKKIAKRLQQFAHEAIPVARLGGDIFALVLTPLADSHSTSSLTNHQ